MVNDRQDEILKENGWRIPDVAEVNEIVAELRRRGFSVHQAAQDFFAKFGGFSAKFESRAHEGLDWFDFDVLNRGFFDVEDVADYGGALGKILCPIGQARRGHLSLVIDEDGAVYGYYNPYIVRVGKSADEAINHLCNETKGLPKAIYDGSPIKFN